MKKFSLICPLILTPVASISVISCSQKRSSGLVTLSSYSDAAVVGVDNKDFWLAAEPAASLKSKALNLTTVGDVQTLYGSNGFNQSVLICKKNILEDNQKYLSSLQTKLQGNYDFVASNENRENIINTINSFLPGDVSPSLSTKTITTQMLKNCNGRYIEQIKDLASYCEFLNKAHNIDSSISLPKDYLSFFKGFPLSGETQSASSYSFYCPDGAPAIGLAKAMCERNDLPNTTNFKVFKPAVILQNVIKDKPDFAVLPSNLATRLFNEYDDSYCWLSTITWGNLYILSKDYKTPITKDNIATILNGKHMGVLQLNSVPGIVLKIILQDNNVKYEE